MLAQKRTPQQQQLSLDELVGHLEAVSLFHDVREVPGALKAISEIMQVRSYRPGVDIISEGEMGSEMYVLISGQASVMRKTPEGDPYKVAHLLADQHAFFGEGGLLDSDPRSATIRADSQCECLVLERTKFEQFCAKRPEVALPVLRRIARAVMSRLRKANNDLMLVYNALVAEVRGH